MVVRHAEPADYGRVIAIVDDWWGGRPMAAMLPKLFFVHFRDTSFVAEEEDELANIDPSLLEPAEGSGGFDWIIIGGVTLLLIASAGALYLMFA